MAYEMHAVNLPDAGNAGSVVYTCPSGRQARILCCSIANTGSAVMTFTLRIKDASDTSAGAGGTLYDINTAGRLGVNETYFPFPKDWQLSAGDEVICIPGTQSASIVLGLDVT